MTMTHDMYNLHDILGLKYFSNKYIRIINVYFCCTFYDEDRVFIKNVLLWAMNINSIEKKVKLKYFQNGDDCNRK